MASSYEANGSAVTNTFTFINGGYRYFTYVLRVQLDGSSSTAVKSCAVEHFAN